MRHYQLVPVRYNAQQLLTRCEPIDAELWSIQWHKAEWQSSDGVNWTVPTVMHWFADVAPLERDNAEAIVTWLNNREQFAAKCASVTPFRSK